MRLEVGVSQTVLGAWFSLAVCCGPAKGKDKSTISKYGRTVRLDLYDIVSHPSNSHTTLTEWENENENATSPNPHTVSLFSCHFLPVSPFVALWCYVLLVS